MEWFGKWGGDMYERAQGISDDPVSGEWERKSAGEQETFEQDTLDSPVVLERARALAGGVFGRLRAEGFAGFRTVTVTVRFSNFVTLNRSRTAAAPLTTQAALEALAHQLLLPFFDERENPRRRKIRLIGVRAEKLVRELSAEMGRTTLRRNRADDASPSTRSQCCVPATCMRRGEFAALSPLPGF